ncbi:MAG: hypothetical protein HY776_05420 [Actinobacteria bacterium]|nr:hypothetical protein [Actinomycetota bacterium]
MILKRLAFSILLILFISQIQSLTVYAAGIGLASSDIIIENGMRGQTYKRSLRVYNTSSKDKISVMLEGMDDVKEWISFYKDKNFKDTVDQLELKPKAQIEVFVLLQIPKSAPNGLYEGKIAVSRFTSKEGNKFKLILPLNVKIKLGGRQIVAGIVRSIFTRDVEVDYNLPISVEFQNIGNVTAQPEIRVQVLGSDGRIVDSFTAKEETVPIETTKVLIAKWKTSDRQMGKYTANVDVLLAGKSISSKSLSFGILKRGSLTRKGILEKLSYSGKPAVGKSIKLKALYRNTGNSDTYAKLVGEVYINNQFDRRIHSEKVLASFLGSGTLDVFLKIEKSGIYKIKGYIDFEGKRSNVKTIGFKIKSPFTVYYLIAGIIVAMVVFLAIIFKPRGKRGKKRRKH